MFKALKEAEEGTALRVNYRYETDQIQTMKGEVTKRGLDMKDDIVLEVDIGYDERVVYQNYGVWFVEGLGKVVAAGAD